MRDKGSLRYKSRHALYKERKQERGDWQMTSYRFVSREMQDLSSVWLLHTSAINKCTVRKQVNVQCVRFTHKVCFVNIQTLFSIIEVDSEKRLCAREKCFSWEGRTHLWNFIIAAF